MRITEEELAFTVVGHLESIGWEVFQEVQFKTYGYTCDIVAKKDDVLWTIECKTTFGFRVIEQAQRWVTFAHKCSIAVPWRESTSYSKVERETLKHFGLSLLVVGERGVMELGELPIREALLDKKLFDTLNDRHKTYAAAGNAEGARWTPFQETVLNLKVYVADNPGCTVREAVENIDTHYASTKTALTSMQHWLSKGVIEGIRMDTSKIPATLFIE